MATQQELDLGNVISTLESNNEIVNAASTANTTANGTGNTDALIATEGLREKPFQRKGNGNGSGNGNGKGKNKDKRWNNDNKVKKNNKNTTTCDYCGRNNHDEKECRDKK